MRRVLLAAALAALTAGCSDPCQELGARICECTPTGSSVQACEQQVDNILKDADPSASEEARCEDYLDTCSAPAGADFCEWLATADGKVACGLAY